MTHRQTPRFTTEQLITLILYRHDGSRHSSHFNRTVRDLQEELTCLSGRRPSIAHIRHLILNLERKGVIERVFHHRQDGRYGDQAQATEYIVKDLYKAFDLVLSDKELETRTQARERDRKIKGSLPPSFSKKEYCPSRAYREAYSPYYKAIMQAHLGPTFPKGDPRNLDRVRNANNVLMDEKAKQRAARLPFVLRHPLHK
ncbi:hypothetical protein ES703_15923 [subsurface metagenome]